MKSAGKSIGYDDEFLVRHGGVMAESWYTKHVETLKGPPCAAHPGLEASFGPFKHSGSLTVAPSSSPSGQSFRRAQLRKAGDSWRPEKPNSSEPGLCSIPGSGAATPTSELLPLSPGEVPANVRLSMAELGRLRRKTPPLGPPMPITSSHSYGYHRIRPGSVGR